MEIFKQSFVNFSSIKGNAISGLSVSIEEIKVQKMEMNITHLPPPDH